jgi:hypothetical protein
MTSPKLHNPMTSPNTLSMNVNANSDLLSQKQSQELPSLPCHVHVPIALLPASKVDLDESLGRHHRRGRESKPFIGMPRGSRRDSGCRSTPGGVCLQRSGEKAIRTHHGRSSSPSTTHHTHAESLKYAPTTAAAPRCPEAQTNHN